MAVQVEAGEIKKEKAMLEFGEFGVEHSPVLGQDGVRLLEEFLIVEYACGKRLGIFGDALRVELADFLGKIFRITRGRRNRERRIGGIDIDRRNVKLKSRMCL